MTTLSCECEWELEPGQTCYWPPDDYSVLKTSKRKRCQSCNQLIDIGTVVGRFIRCKEPDNDVDEQIYGICEDIGLGIPMADHYLCEECMDLYYSLDALGFCGQLYENQRDLVAEYNNEFLPALEQEQENE